MHSQNRISEGPGHLSGLASPFGETVTSPQVSQAQWRRDFGRRSFRHGVLFRYRELNQGQTGRLRIRQLTSRPKQGILSQSGWEAAAAAYPSPSSQLIHVTMDPYTLVLIARTQSLARNLRAALNPAQYLIRWVPSTSQALALNLHASLVLLDAPPTGGRRSVAWLKRRFEAPLLFLSRNEATLIESADATLYHPFTVEQLVSQIQTTLMTCTPDVVQVPGMSLDTKTHRLQLGGSLRQLRPTGSRILAALMARPGEVVSRNDLFREVWHTEDVDNTRALDVHISYLRRIVEATPRYPELIVTVRGMGYRLEPPTA